MRFLATLTHKTLGASIAVLGTTALLTGCQSLHATTNGVATPVTTSQAATQTTVQTMSNHTTALPQTAATSKPNVTAPTMPALASQQFTINGKIGITTPKQAGSAFYIWTQQGQNFAIELAGAMNAGQTKISYNGQSASLTNEKGTLNAATPEELLQRATGWQAPISQLPYWIQGQPAPSDTNDKTDSASRLVTAQNGDWTAAFSYANNSDKRPIRLTARHPDGYKVVMTINRLS